MRQPIGRRRAARSSYEPDTQLDGTFHVTNMEESHELKVENVDNSRGTSRQTENICTRNSDWKPGESAMVRIHANHCTILGVPM